MWLGFIGAAELYGHGRGYTCIIHVYTQVSKRDLKESPSLKKLRV